MKKVDKPLPPDACQRYERRIAHTYFVRFHMSLILAAVIASGVLTSKGLLDLGVHSLRLRYPLAVLGSYLVFLLLVRVWIWYVSIRGRAVDRLGGPDIDGGFGGIGLGGAGPSGFTKFGGGSSGGAGA